ncbi:hypothetical protein BKA70DRAFT_1231972 [Coprinopsis sp. MPI-PUGE-AT-0042]|nr:hypothetical protein BKA70DRAFT_1231972 [Coprinopsis sp. MPI-PUGE-AT-0042]
MATRICKPLPCAIQLMANLTADEFTSLCTYLAKRAIDCLHGYMEMEEDLEYWEKKTYIKHAKAEVDTAIWTLGCFWMKHPGAVYKEHDGAQLLQPLMKLLALDDWTPADIALCINYRGPFPVPVDSGPFGSDFSRHLWWRRALFDLEDKSRLHNRNQALRAWKAYTLAKDEVRESDISEVETADEVEGSTLSG